MRTHFASGFLILLPLGAACTKSPATSVDPARLPLPDVTLEQCGPAPSSGMIYLEGQVTRRPDLKRIGRLRYPWELRAHNVGGEVRLAFVIDSTGKAVESSLRTLAATDPGFTEVSRRMVLTSRFLPALLEGHPVAVCTAQKIRFTP